jgi:spore coat polysaccharide biosynthesis protein SpsF
MEGGVFDKSIGFIIQARVASTRLPGKVLLPMPFGSEETILGQICAALETLGAKVIIATSTKHENDAIQAFCDEKNISCFRGDENDVFSRFVEIQKEFRFSHIFRFTADNPLIDRGKLIEFFEMYLSKELDYAYSKGMPLGMNFEVFKGEVLIKEAEKYLTANEMEHVTISFRENNQYRTANLLLGEYSDYRMTVDTPIDYAQLSLVFQCKELFISDGLELIDNCAKWFPWILNLNKGILQNNNCSSIEDEYNMIATFAETMGYHAAANRLRTK